MGISRAVIDYTCTADCKGLAPRRKDMLRGGKIIRFICGKSIVVFHCSAYLLQDFCNLLYSSTKFSLS